MGFLISLAWIFPIQEIPWKVPPTLECQRKRKLVSGLLMHIEGIMILTSPPSALCENNEKKLQRVSEKGKQCIDSVQTKSGYGSY